MPAVTRELAPTEVRSTPSTARYGIPIFLGAFLLFLVEPLVAKYFLPWFGGAPAVWTTCMFFFQLLLLAGYAYADVLVNRLRPRAQATVHVSLLLAALALLIFLSLLWPSPLTPGASWKPHGDEQPIGRLLALLAISVGLPYLVLSTTGPLLQAWFSRTSPRGTPYRLYAVSNFASLLALLSYPFLIEPWLPLKLQARLWSLAFLVFAMACGYCAIGAGLMKSQPDCEVEDDTGDNFPATGAITKPATATYILWLSLAACGSVMFLASTTQICQDIAIVPFLWILPLSIYLLSFVICFEKPAWYVRGPFHSAFALSLFAACYVLGGGAVHSIVMQVVIYSCTLFLACMICHGELYRAKPSPRFLTSFYLMVAVGGALGGIFVALFAPYAFRFSWEYEFGLWASVVLMFVVLIRDQQSWLYRATFGMSGLALGTALIPFFPLIASEKVGLSRLSILLVVLIAVLLLARKPSEVLEPARARAAVIYCAISVLIFAVTLALIARGQVQGAVLMARNFYGVLTVREVADQPGWQLFKLYHGRVSHGSQLRDPRQRGLPTAYYGRSSGIGQAMAAVQARLAQSTGRHTFRVGVVGLGVGTLATYGRRGDYFRFYEINPDVVRIAQDTSYFTYLHDCPAAFDIVLGDARLSMEEELRRGNSQRFDLLAIDAFSGDAVPVHLLTEEAFAIYLQQIRQPDGVIAVHISNAYLDLRPVVRGVADHFGLGYLWIDAPGDGRITSESEWVLLSRDRDFLQSLSASNHNGSFATPGKPVLWTDDYSNLFHVLRR